MNKYLTKCDDSRLEEVITLYKEIEWQSKGPGMCILLLVSKWSLSQRYITVRKSTVGTFLCVGTINLKKNIGNSLTILLWRLKRSKTWTKVTVCKNLLIEFFLDIYCFKFYSFVSELKFETNYLILASTILKYSPTLFSNYGYIFIFLAVIA